MFTKKIYPEQISPSELDQYLAAAWYRMGQGIFTCHFLSFGERIYSAVWLRLNFQNFEFKKSQRKLFRKNEHFKIVFQKSCLNKQKEDLYQKYRLHAFKDNISLSLKNSLLDGKHSNIYDTMECCVYDQEKLIAVSFFDLGKNSISSILGMYDPDYQEYSLGYFSMLLEMDYGIKNNYSFYYPGYVVPGYSRFDYKTRIGAVEYYNISKKEWLPFDSIEKKEFPLDAMVIKLNTLQEEIKKQKIQSKIYYYPLFENPIFSFWEVNYLGFPVFLWCKTIDDPQNYTLIVYDLNRQRFLLLECELMGEIPDFLEELFEESNDQQSIFLETLLIKQAAIVDQSEQEFAHTLSKWNRLKRIK